MEHSLLIKDLRQIDSAAAEFLSLTEGKRLFAFYGGMGAGKTTFTSAICRCLGVRDDAVGSPTFAIVNEYRTASARSVFHFDFYRIDRPEEVLDIGFYDYIDSGCMCIMEWPENVGNLLPAETLKVNIDVLADGSRRISWED